VEQRIDDGSGKPVHIWTPRHVSSARRRDADGDAALLETVRFGLLIHHDNAERESPTTPVPSRHSPRLPRAIA
jgi:hypothetical protein